MARNEIEVNGVKLTRAQLEDAVKRINEPETTRLKPGDVVSWARRGSTWLVIRHEALETALNSIKGKDKVLLVDKYGDVSYTSAEQRDIDVELDKPFIVNQK